MEGPTLLNMRIKHLIKVDSVDKAAHLAKMCSEYPGYEGKGNFKQTYLVCICLTKSQDQLMEEVRNYYCENCNIASLVNWKISRIEIEKKVSAIIGTPLRPIYTLLSSLSPVHPKRYLRQCPSLLRWYEQLCNISSRGQCECQSA